MGFNNGYDSGYSDCEAENRKRWEKDAVERYKAENPPSGGGSSSGSPIETIDLYACYDIDDGYFHVDLSGLGVGESKMFRVPDTADPPMGHKGLLGMLAALPEEVTQVYDSTFNLYDSPVTLTPRDHTIIIGDAADINTDRDWGSGGWVGITRASNTIMYAWPVCTPMA